MSDEAKSRTSLINWFEAVPDGGFPTPMLLMIVADKSAAISSVATCYGATVIVANRNNTRFYDLGGRHACAAYLNGIRKRSESAGFSVYWLTVGAAIACGLHDFASSWKTSWSDRLPRNAFEGYHPGGDGYYGITNLAAGGANDLWSSLQLDEGAADSAVGSAPVLKTPTATPETVAPKLAPHRAPRLIDATAYLRNLASS